VSYLQQEGELTQTDSDEKLLAIAEAMADSMTEQNATHERCCDGSCPWFT